MNFKTQFMRFALLGMLLTFFVGSLAAQNAATSEKTKIKTGISLGLNYSNIIVEEVDNLVLHSEDALGFRLGIQSEIPLKGLFYFWPKAELSFNGGKINIGTDAEQTYKIMPINVEVAAHFSAKMKKSGFQPYCYAGPGYKIPIAKIEDSSTTFYSTKNDLAIDFGIGMDRSLSRFDIAPELRYSFGLLDVNSNPLLKSVNHHNISLIIHFKG